MNKLIFIELNEINIDYLRFYIKKGLLPNWARIINRYGVQLTDSEKIYDEIEPWIQWPTIRTGLTYLEHQIFRLGDICNSNKKQHWEILEEKGYSVAAMSPINAANRTKNSPFWIPDPWVDTPVSGGIFIQKIAKAIKQAVNDNAQEKINFSTKLTLIEAFLRKTLLSSWGTYIKCIWGAFTGRHWPKAIILDRLLTDIYLKLWKEHQPDFSTLFLNAGAHIQHHYMCSSLAYRGNIINPSWYVASGEDPVYEILNAYDSILFDLLKLKNTRIMLASGMRQVPYEDNTYYWRLRSHEIFLKELGVSFKKVQPRMTRDFLIEFENLDDAKKAELVLKSIESEAGEKIFGSIDNRGNDIFVTLTYAKEINDTFFVRYGLDQNKTRDLSKDVVFVAIKNGHHDSLGFFIDTFVKDPKVIPSTPVMPIKNIFYKIMDHFNCNN